MLVKYIICDMCKNKIECSSNCINYDGYDSYHICIDCEAKFSEYLAKKHKLNEKHKATITKNFADLKTSYNLGEAKQDDF